MHHRKETLVKYFWPFGILWYIKELTYILSKYKETGDSSSILKRLCSRNIPIKEVWDN